MAGKSHYYFNGLSLSIYIFLFLCRMRVGEYMTFCWFYFLSAYFLMSHVRIYFYFFPYIFKHIVLFTDTTPLYGSSRQMKASTLELLTSNKSLKQSVFFIVRKR